MDKLRISRVDDVQIIRHGVPLSGTLHLMPHHLIFCHAPSTPEEYSTDSNQAAAKVRPKEVWITYHIISRCNFRPAPAGSSLSSSIRLQCRDFTFVAFNFANDKSAKDVYDSIRSLTCKLGRIEKVYAFSYRPQPPEKGVNSWGFYDARRELERLGVGGHGPDSNWRISDLNKDYRFSPTYPALLAVPATISDNVLNYAGKYRSRARIPALTYLHPVNNCTITRSSQPLAGFRGNRSIQDEKLVGAIFATTQNDQASRRLTQTYHTASDTQGLDKDGSSADTRESEGVDAIEDELIAAASEDMPSKEKTVYGAQQHNLIVDARPTVNAIAMQAVGLGSENMDNYKSATKAYLGIDNIHVMRDSLAKVVEAIKDSDITPLPPNRELLVKSGWLKHISGLLDGAGLIARQVGLQHSHVLIHCSDGWDRTSQLSALSQLCLDPYYRTLDGFIVLVEKDWLSFGHMFRHRCGFLSSERWFVTQSDGLGGSAAAGGHIGLAHSGSGGSALENALLTAKGFFNKDNSSRESLPDSDGEMVSYQNSAGDSKSSPASRAAASAIKETTKVKETSPVFHQFLDATYQLLRQYPTRFEFNERFLRRLLYHLYSCQYGTFLYDSEKARVEARINERTRSVWDYFLARREQFLNKEYTGSTVDERERDRERLIFPRPAEVRWWSEVFGRSDEEMNGTGLVASGEGSVLTGIENSQASMGAGAGGASSARAPSPRLSPLRSGGGLSATIAKLGIGPVAGGGEAGGVGEPGREIGGHANAPTTKAQMELEMQ